MGPISFHQNIALASDDGVQNGWNFPNIAKGCRRKRQGARGGTAVSYGEPSAMPEHMSSGFCKIGVYSTSKTVLQLILFVGGCKLINLGKNHFIR